MAHPLIERHHVANIPSTQTEACSHFQELKHGQWRVYTADEQSEGQGTHGRTWYSPKGNIYASYIFLLPEAAQRALSNISQIAAFSIRQMIEQYHMPPTIKWPNDVLFGRKKIAGILTEATTITSDIQKIASYYGICIGIGVNVNVEEADLTQAGQPATSLKTVAKQAADYDLNQMIEVLSEKLHANITKLVEEGYASFSDQLNACLERFDELPIIFDTEKSDPRYYIGFILGVDKEGALALRTRDGEERFINGRILHGSEIEKALTDEALQTLIKQINFDRIPSTQIYAREHSDLVKDGFWHLVTAKAQTGGMGSSGEWSSPPENLYATFLLPKPESLTASPLQISEIVAFSITDLLKEMGLIDAEMKWRNDVKIGDKKISGVLVEIGDVIAITIIGIGININSDPAATTLLDQETTSIKAELKREEDLDIEEVLRPLEKKLYLNMQLLQGYGFTHFLPFINEILKYKGEEVTVTSLVDGSVTKGTQGTIDPSGGILIKTEEGDKTLMEGHLRLLLPASQET